MAPDMEVFLLSDKPFSLHIPVQVCSVAPDGRLRGGWVGFALASGLPHTPRSFNLFLRRPSSVANHLLIVSLYLNVIYLDKSCYYEMETDQLMCIK